MSPALPIHPDASCVGIRRSGSSSSKHHEPSRSSSTRRSESSSSKHHEPSRSSSTRDGRSDKKFEGHHGTITRLHRPGKLAAIEEKPERITSVSRFSHESHDHTQTRSSRHHDDDRTETRSSRHHTDDRTKTLSRRQNADANTRSWSARDDECDSHRTIRPSDSVSQASYSPSSTVSLYPSDSVSNASYCNSNSGQLVPRDRSRSSASQSTYDSWATPTVRESTMTRTSSTRGSSSSRRGSSTRELEKRVQRLESSNAKALERKVEDLERQLKNMHVDNAIERRAMRNAYYQQEARKINEYALTYDGEAYYLQLLNRVNPSRYVYL